MFVRKSVVLSLLLIIAFAGHHLFFSDEQTLSERVVAKSEAEGIFRLSAAELTSFDKGKIWRQLRAGSVRFLPNNEIHLAKKTSGLMISPEERRTFTAEKGIVYLSGEGLFAKNSNQPTQAEFKENVLISSDKDAMSLATETLSVLVEQEIVSSAEPSNFKHQNFMALASQGFVWEGKTGVLDLKGKVSGRVYGSKSW